ncbi:histidine phosphatase family protein [Lacinutrix sp. Bg11-31]|uniref:SixA phosphatase family protein n=1 Tax=Lacinutrix sp. Bg11-31 TaxID=2057808 RepID=UPI000C31A2BA|nr:phosphoglycerate mutase family protein [Lacinutrix sp. Bg11-31]AUC81886.1 phosphoglycerate mutase [Lacinutrix sp. Bg11-31]
MKKLLLFCLLITAFSCVKAQNETKVNKVTTTYYLIRHAEKDKSDSSNQNPKLIEKGQKRAEKWSNHFKNINLDAVYSTNYNRTIETALPTATNKGLEITPYDPKTLDLKIFLEQTKNQTVLIVGHSNTTPNFVNKIIDEEKHESINETINSKLFIVTINNKNVTTSKVIDID